MSLAMQVLVVALMMPAGSDGVTAAAMRV